MPRFRTAKAHDSTYRRVGHPQISAAAYWAVQEFLLDRRDVGPIATELALGNASRAQLPRRSSR